VFEACIEEIRKYDGCGSQDLDLDVVSSSHSLGWKLNPDVVLPLCRWACKWRELLQRRAGGGTVACWTGRLGEGMLVLDARTPSGP